MEAEAAAAAAEVTAVEVVVEDMEVVVVDMEVVEAMVVTAEGGAMEGIAVVAAEGEIVGMMVDLATPAVGVDLMGTGETEERPIRYGRLMELGLYSRDGSGYLGFLIWSMLAGF